jgi:hypothetical protein
MIASHSEDRIIGLTLLFTALLMLGGLGAPIFATAAAGKRTGMVALAAGFMAALIGIRTQALPDPAWIGSVVAAVAAIELFRRDFRFLAPLCGGALAGLWSALLQIQGLPLAAAVIVAGLVPGIAVWLSARSRTFAPDALRQEAMLAMMAMGLAVAMIPNVAAGWQTAVALNRDEADRSKQIIANWVLVLSAVSVVLGGLYSLLRRR